MRFTLKGTVALGVFLAMPASVRADEPTTSTIASVPEASDAATPAVESPAEARTAVDDGRRTLRRLPVNIGRGFAGVFHQENVFPAIAGATLAGGATFLDEELRVDEARDDWSDDLEVIAGPIWSSAFVISMFTAGQLSHGPRFRAMTYDMLDASIVNFGYTEVLKVAVGRERPNAKDHKSFPSGHTSNAFTLATVAERHYGWKVGVPAYLFAGLVGASRLKQDMHYLSDVVAGATVGFIVGRSVVRMNGGRSTDGRGVRLNLTPLVGRHTRGLRASISF